MVATALVLLAIAIGSTMGWLVYRLTATRLHKRWTRAVASLTSGGVVFVGAAISFLLFELTTPANDAHQFEGAQELHVEVVPDSSGPRNEALHITLAIPASVRSNDDFPVRLTVSVNQAGLERSETSAALLTPPSIKGRTLQSCTGSTSPQTQENMVVACATGTSSRTIVWDVTPTGAGSARVAVRVLSESIPRSWRAVVYLDGEQLVRTQSGLRFGARRGSSSVERHEAVFLTADMPAVEVAGVGVDLSSMQFRATVSVLTTLGVSARTYGYLAVMGTAVASLLGTGWLWQFLSRRRASKHDNGSETRT